jgi:hypothetical protein
MSTTLRTASGDPCHLFLAVFFFRGTFAPDFLASESPIAMACLRLVTFFPERPLLRVPRFRSCIARLTLRLAAEGFVAMAYAASARV